MSDKKEQKTFVRKVSANTSDEVQQICEDALTDNKTVLAITPNMDKATQGGYAINFTSEPAYWIFIDTRKRVSSHVVGFNRVTQRKAKR